jgi:hypothetical protein
MKDKNSDDYGICPNCGREDIRISKLETMDRKICCEHCYIPASKKYTIDDVEFKKMNLETKDGKYKASTQPGYHSYWWGNTIADDVILEKQRRFTYKKKSKYHFFWKRNDSPKEQVRCKQDGVDKLNELLANANVTFVW